MRRHPKVFSPFYVSMVQVGEMTGMLDEIFMRLYDHLEFERDMRERIKTAMRYPSFVLIAMAIAIVIINLFVIPAFAKVYAGFHAEIAAVTKMLIGFSGFMVNYWMLVLALIVGAVVGFRFIHQHAGWTLQVGQVQIQASGRRGYHSQIHTVAIRPQHGAVLQERDADPAGNERGQHGGGQ